METTISVDLAKAKENALVPGGIEPLNHATEDWDHGNHGLMKHGCGKFSRGPRTAWEMGGGVLKNRDTP